jgi:hypothetical protein
MNDDDKDFDKTVTRLMIGGALLTNAVFAVGYDPGYQSGAKRVPEPTIIHGNVTINNNSNNFSQPTP